MPMLSRAAVFSALLLLLPLPAAAADSAHADVTQLLETSARAWNRGDLTTFMRSYENSSRTEYVSSKRIIYGYAAIRAHYASSYGHGSMGTLSFSDLIVRSLGSNYAVVVAHWHVVEPNGRTPTGIFSLVLHRGAMGWRIIVDHSP